jgi:hypothetical protein
MRSKSDLNKVIGLFDELGVGYNKIDSEDSITVELIVGQDKVDGYNYFMSNYFFDKDENFKKIVIGE